MNTDTSTSRRPRGTIAAGVALFLLAIGLLCVFVIGLKTNETMGFSKHQSGLVSRQDNPVEFWLTESVSLIFAIMLAVKGIKLFKTTSS
jgi:hypothetical protein